MITMNISLPAALKFFVNERVAKRGRGTSSKYVCELMRKGQERQYLRGLLLKGAASARVSPADAACFDGLRERVHVRHDA